MTPPVKRSRGAVMTRVDTPVGPAEVHLERPTAAPVALVVLGHGAGGDSSAPALVRVAEALLEYGVAVARFDQPYRVAGRRAPAPSASLDRAASAVVQRLRSDGGLDGVPLLVGGKSSGARVACRVAGAVGAVGVIALGFPLRPPRRPDRTRAPELQAVPCPALVCQGARDVFGTPAEVVEAVRELQTVTVHAVRGGDHSFAARRADGRATAECLAEVAAVTVRWTLAQTVAT